MLWFHLNLTSQITLYGVQTYFSVLGKFSKLRYKTPTLLLSKVNIQKYNLSDSPPHFNNPNQQIKETTPGSFYSHHAVCFIAVNVIGLRFWEI